ncbi:MAG: outer membrane beta-barrel protein [Bacteroidetes bacterium]|jgi:hypothetical protein|nr:outer membrane beta-barrel protein [Bacteroidota bacterium]
MLKQLTILIILVSFGFRTNAQPFPKSSNFRVGMNAGINTATLIGTELQNPQLKTAIVLGAAYRQKFSKSMHLGAELNASFRGSNFDNGITDAYSAVKFIYIDLPINAMINMSGKAENRYLTLGVEPAYLLQSEIYVKPNDFKATYKDYGFQNFDVSAVVGYHFDFYYFGLRPSVRFGLVNINNNLKLENVFPETGNNGSITSLTFDLKLYF